ncbi:hypothetical protein B0H13DRAFT_1884914 [Mycena leptocephala]|nr:hypothetical protein B0H13DRAFT_1884914 [Mycena leptocephala]
MKRSVGHGADFGTHWPRQIQETACSGAITGKTGCVSARRSANLSKERTEIENGFGKKYSQKTPQHNSELIVRYLSGLSVGQYDHNDESITFSTTKLLPLSPHARRKIVRADVQPRVRPLLRFQLDSLYVAAAASESDELSVASGSVSGSGGPRRVPSSAAAPTPRNAHLEPRIRHQRGDLGPPPRRQKTCVASASSQRGGSGRKSKSRIVPAPPPPSTVPRTISSVGKSTCVGPAAASASMIREKGTVLQPRARPAAQRRKTAMRAGVRPIEEVCARGCPWCVSRSVSSRDAVASRMIQLKVEKNETSLIASVVHDALPLAVPVIRRRGTSSRTFRLPCQLPSLTLPALSSSSSSESPLEEKEAQAAETAPHAGGGGGVRGQIESQLREWVVNHWRTGISSTFVRVWYCALYFSYMGRSPTQHHRLQLQLQPPWDSALLARRSLKYTVARWVSKSRCPEIDPSPKYFKARRAFTYDQLQVSEYNTTFKLCFRPRYIVCDTDRAESSSYVSVGKCGYLPARTKVFRLAHRGRLSRTDEATLNWLNAALAMAYNTGLVLLVTIPCVVKHTVQLASPMNTPMFCTMMAGCYPSCCRGQPFDSAHT